jgi:hypothetical protein
MGTDGSQTDRMAEMLVISIYLIHNAQNNNDAALHVPVQ